MYKDAKMNTLDTETNTGHIHQKQYYVMLYYIILKYYDRLNRHQTNGEGSSVNTVPIDCPGVTQ